MFAPTEISAGVSFALFYMGVKIWCAYGPSTGTRICKHCCHSQNVFTFNAAQSTWTWDALFTIYFSTPRRFILKCLFSHSRSFNFGKLFAKIFNKTGRQYYYYKLVDTYSNIGLVYFWRALWWGPQYFLNRIFISFAGMRFLSYNRSRIK